MKRQTLFMIGLASLLASATQAYSQEQLAKSMQEAPAETALNRTVLPIPEPDYPRSTVLDALSLAATVRSSADRTSGCWLLAALP